MPTRKVCLLLPLLIFTVTAVLDAQMDPYFTAIKFST